MSTPASVADEIVAEMRQFIDDRFDDLARDFHRRCDLQEDKIHRDLAHFHADLEQVKAQVVKIAARMPRRDDA